MAKILYVADPDNQYYTLAFSTILAEKGHLVTKATTDKELAAGIAQADAIVIFGDGSVLFTKTLAEAVKLPPTLYVSTRLGNRKIKGVKYVQAPITLTRFLDQVDKLLQPN